MQNKLLQQLLNFLSSEEGQTSKPFRDLIERTYILYEIFSQEEHHLFNLQRGSIECETNINCVSLNMTSCNGSLYRITVEPDVYKITSLITDRKFKIQDRQLLRRMAWVMKNMENELLNSTQTKTPTNSCTPSSLKSKPEQQ